MGILDGTMNSPQITAPQLPPDLQAMLAQGGAAPQTSAPMPSVAAGLPQIGAQPSPQAAQPPPQHVLDPASAQKNPSLVVPGVIINGHVYTGGDKADEANWKMLTGDDFLTTIPQSERLTVQQMVQGRMPFPGSRSLTTPYWQQKLQEAQQYDPSFDATVWDARAKTAKDFTPGGKTGQILQSGSTAINHLGHLNSQIGDVSGIALPLIGDPINAMVNKWNAPQGHLNPYLDTSGHLAEETTKFYRSTGGAEGDIIRNMANLSPDLSTEAKQGGVNNTVQLIYGKLKPLADAYNQTMGTNFPPSHFLSPDAAKTMKGMGFDPDTGEKMAKASAPTSKPQQQPMADPQSIVNELRRRGVKVQ